MKIAAAYIRVSTEEQTEYSPAAQLRLIRAWAENNGFAVDSEHIYVDEGISGRRAEKRPAFMRMIAAAKRKPAPFDAILVHRFDRFARSREDSVVYKSMLRRDCGVQVISVTESIEDDKFSVILEAMLEAMAEYYSINLADEVRKGMTEKARCGGRQTYAPFGYRTVSGQLVPEPTEAALVVEVFRRFVDGESYFAIARWLNGIGARTRNGCNFQNRSVRYILRNITYIGKNAWTPKREHDHSSGYVITENTIISDATHAPIVSHELWNAAQQRIEKLKIMYPHSSQPTKHADWLSGIVRCPHCGSVMVRNIQGKYANGEPKIFWVCNGYAHGVCQHTNSCKDSTLKDVVINAISALATNDAQLLSAMQAARSRKNDPFPAMLQKLDQQLARAADAYRNGVDTLEEYAATKKMITEERARIEAAERREMEIDATETGKALKRVATTISSVAGVLKESSASIDEKHSAAHELIERIVFDKETSSAFVILNEQVF